MNVFKRFYAPATEFISVRFALTTCIAIVLVSTLILVVYSIITSLATQISLLQEQQDIVAAKTLTFENYLQHLSLLLEKDYETNAISDKTLLQNFSGGIIAQQNGFITTQSGNKVIFTQLTNFTKTISLKTPVYSLDSANKALFITILDTTTPSNFITGAIDLQTPAIQNMLTSSEQHIYLVSFTGDALTQTAQSPTLADLSVVGLQYTHAFQQTIGSFDRQAITYAPISQTELGILARSNDILSIVHNQIIFFLFYLIVLSIILFLAMLIIFAVLIDTPIIRILTFFDDYKKGNTRQIRISSQDTLGEIATDINELIQQVSNDFKRIQSADQIQEDFLLLSAHLLRTPLTSLQGYLDLLSSAHHDKTITPFIENMENALQKLKQIEENILSISQESTSLINAPITHVAIADILQEAYTQMLPVAEEKHITFSYDDTQVKRTPVFIDVNKEAFIHVLRNIIDNACKFTPEGGTVKLYTRLIEKNIIISISDTGIGLTDEEKKHLFTKFYKVSQVMRYGTEGLGLGLYVVKLIIERYNGNITVDSIKGNGSIFNIKLPIQA